MEAKLERSMLEADFKTCLGLATDAGFDTAPYADLKLADLSDVELKQLVSRLRDLLRTPPRRR